MMRGFFRLYFLPFLFALIVGAPLANLMAKELPNVKIQDFIEPYFIRACFELETKLLSGKIEEDDAALPNLRNEVVRRVKEDGWDFDQRRLNGVINMLRFSKEPRSLEDATIVETYVNTDFKQKKGPLYSPKNRPERRLRLLEIGQRRGWCDAQEVAEARELFQIEDSISARRGKGRPDTQIIYESFRRSTDSLEKRIRSEEVSPEEVRESDLFEVVERDMIHRGFDVPNGWIRSVIHTRKRMELESGSYVSKELPDIYTRTSFEHRAGGFFALLRRERQREVELKAERASAEKSSPFKPFVAGESPHSQISKLLIRLENAFLFQNKARFRKGERNEDFEDRSPTMEEAKKNLEQFLTSRDIHSFIPYSILIGEGEYSEQTNRFRISTNARFAMLVPQLTSSGAFSAWYGLILELSTDGFEIILFETFGRKTVFSNLQFLAKEMSRIRASKNEKISTLYTVISNVAYARTGIMGYTAYSRYGKSLVASMEELGKILDTDLHQLGLRKGLPPSLLRALRNGLAKGAIDPFFRTFGIDLKQSLVQRMGIMQEILSRYGLDKLVQSGAELESLLRFGTIDPLTVSRVLDEWIQEAIYFWNLRREELSIADKKMIKGFLPDLVEFRVMLTYFEGTESGDESSYYAILGEAHRWSEKSPGFINVRLEPYAALTFANFQNSLKPRFEAQRAPFRSQISR